MTEVLQILGDGETRQTLKKAISACQPVLSQTKSRTYALIIRSSEVYVRTSRIVGFVVRGQVRSSQISPPLQTVQTIHRKTNES